MMQLFKNDLRLYGNQSLYRAIQIREGCVVFVVSIIIVACIHVRCFLVRAVSAVNFCYQLWRI